MLGLSAACAAVATGKSRRAQKRDSGLAPGAFGVH